MVTMDTFDVKGVLRLDFPSDVDMEVDAYSKKQAIHKVFLELKQYPRFSKVNNVLLYNAVKKLTFIKQ